MVLLFPAPPPTCKDHMTDIAENNCPGLLPPLSQLELGLQRAVGLLEALLSRRPQHLSWQLPGVLQVSTPLLHSPLAAPRLRQLILDIGVCLMPPELRYLGTHRARPLVCSNPTPRLLLTLHFPVSLSAILSPSLPVFSSSCFFPSCIIVSCIQITDKVLSRQVIL